MQRPLLLGSQPTLLSNLVAELRLPTGRLLMCCCITFLATVIFVLQVGVMPMFPAVLTSNMWSVDNGSSAVGDSNNLNVDVDNNVLGDSRVSSVDVDHKSHGGNSAVTNKLMERVLDSANREAEKAIGRVESLEQALKETLQPSDMIQRLIQVLTDDEAGNTKQSLDLHAVGADYVSSKEPNVKSKDPLRDFREFLLSTDGDEDGGRTTTTTTDLQTGQRTVGILAGNHGTRVDEVPLSQYFVPFGFANINMSNFLGTTIPSEGFRANSTDSQQHPRRLGWFEQNFDHWWIENDDKLKTAKKKLRHMWMLVTFAGVCIVMSAVCSMVGGGRPFAGNRPPASFSDNGPPYQGTSTLKVPPSWCCERAHTYSLRAWLSDLSLWTASTDVEAHRQGPLAALQISGAARELVREIAPHVLRDGVVDPQTGNHVPGVMVLARTLAERYAPLETELQTQAMSELMSFSKIHSESVDQCLTRFDVLRHRAQQRAGLNMTPQGLSWLLLNGFKLRPDMWDRILAANDGHLPDTEQQFRQMLERMRRLGHLLEGGFQHNPNIQGGTGQTGNQYMYFPMFGADDMNPPMPSAAFHGQSAHEYSGQSSTGLDAAINGLNAAPTSMPFGGQSFYGNDMTEYEDQCTRCGMFYADSDISSATMSDEGEADPEAQVFHSVDVDGQTRTDEQAIGDAIYQAYLVAKQRWRRFSGRPPRRYRRFHRNQHKHNMFRNRLQKGPYSRTFAAFLPSSAFAGGKGKGSSKGKSSGPRKNPRGRDGQPLKCSKCGSDEHLWRKCPQVSSASGSNARPAQTSLAMLSNVAMKALPSMHFAVHQARAMLVEPSRGIGQSLSDELASLSSVTRKRSADDDESEVGHKTPKAQGESHESLSTAKSSPASRPRFAPPSHEAPTLEEITGGSASAAGEQSSPPAASCLDVLSPGLVDPTMTNMSNAVPMSTVGGSMFPMSTASGPMPLAMMNMFSGSTTNVDSASRRPSSALSVGDARPDQQTRNATTLQLTELLHGLESIATRNASHADQSSRSQSHFPWWEADRVADTSLTMDDFRAFHSKTRIQGRVGLLVDPGAHDNLGGSRTVEELSRQVHAAERRRKLTQPLEVSGVGRDSQQALESVTLPCSFQKFSDRKEKDTLVEGSFTCPVIPESSLPLLLGLKSLRSKQAVLDMDQQRPKLIIPGPGGIHYNHSPGTQVYELETSESGHLILPVHATGLSPAANDEEPALSPTHDQSTMENAGRLDFQMKCRSVKPKKIQADDVTQDVEPERGRSRGRHS